MDRSPGSQKGDELIRDGRRLDVAEATYSERQSCANEGEKLFEAYCRGRGIRFHRFGFDEKNGNIELFYRLHPLLRSLPDYVVPYLPTKTLYLIHVKGTDRVKLTDIDLYEEFEYRFCGKGCEMRVGFFFPGAEPTWMTVAELRARTEGLTPKRFASDGKEYYLVPLGPTCRRRTAGGAT